MDELNDDLLAKFIIMAFIPLSQLDQQISRMKLRYLSYKRLRDSELRARAADVPMQMYSVDASTPVSELAASCARTGTERGLDKIRSRKVVRIPEFRVGQFCERAV